MTSGMTESSEPLKEKEHFEKRKVSSDHDTVYKDQDSGWAWVVLLAAFMTFCLLGAALFAVGIIHVTLLERYGASISITAWAGALHTALISLAGPVSSMISDRFSCRVAIVVAGFMYLGGYGLTAFAPNIAVAIVTSGVIAGTAGGIAYTANVVIVGYYFQKRRNLALGIATSGNGIGVFVLAPLMQMLKDHYGSFGFFILLAAIYSNMIVFGILCFPSELELQSKMKRTHAVTSYANKSSCLTLLRYVRVIRNKAVICFSISMFNYCLALYLLFLYFPVFIVLKGFSAPEAALFVSISGIVSAGGRFLTGAVANLKWISDIVVYSVSIAIVAVISFVYPFIATHHAGQVAYFVILGVFMSSCFVLVTGVSLKFIPMEDLAVAIGLEFAFGGIGAVLGPVFAGLLVDGGGTYEQAIIAAASCTVLAAVFGGVTLCFEQRTRECKIQIEE